MEIIERNRCFDGEQLRIKHHSQALSCDMIFALYMPPQAATKKVPVLWWLSGLTCNDQNFVTKAGSQRIAAELGIAIIAPDTSPRGDDVPDDADKAWDFGLGAGFYINATQVPFDTSITACTIMCRANCQRWLPKNFRTRLMYLARASVATRWVAMAR
jgi:S-formylglutathione hydrolase